MRTVGAHRDRNHPTNHRSTPQGSNPSSTNSLSSQIQPLKGWSIVGTHSFRGLHPRLMILGPFGARPATFRHSNSKVTFADLCLLPSCQLMQNLGVGLVHGQKGVAGVAVLSDLAAAFRLVIAVVAPEAARKIVVPQIVGISPPGDVHFGEDVSLINV